MKKLNILQILWIKLNIIFTKTNYYKIYTVPSPKVKYPNVYCIRTSTYYTTSLKPFVNNKINYINNLKIGDIKTGELINNYVRLNFK